MVDEHIINDLCVRYSFFVTIAIINNPEIKLAYNENGLNLF